jgi:NAD(P)-dependent dehydrogenase (short-subunit alcohol dehydrogenase family)
MGGKTVAITGTTSGTGNIAARTCLELGAKVLLLNRNSSRSSASAQELLAQFPAATLHAVDCDLQSFDSVRKAIQEVHTLCPEGIHVLANNAGVMALEDVATVDGFDVQMQTNHLSHFLLTKGLMPLLEKAAVTSGEARVVNHSSVARMQPSKKLSARYLEKNGGNLGGNGASMIFGGARWKRYNQSKLANCAFTAALHHKLQAAGSKVKALVAHPGLAKTNLQNNSIEHGGMGRWFTSMFMKMAQSMEDGAMGLLSGMLLPTAQSGEFYGPGKGTFAMKGKAVMFPLESFYDNEQTRELLWQKSCEAIGEDFEI